MPACGRPVSGLPPPRCQAALRSRVLPSRCIELRAGRAVPTCSERARSSGAVPRALRAERASLSQVIACLSHELSRVSVMQAHAQCKGTARAFAGCRAARCWCSKLCGHQCCCYATLKATRCLRVSEVERAMYHCWQTPAGTAQSVSSLAERSAFRRAFAAAPGRAFAGNFPGVTARVLRGELLPCRCGRLRCPPILCRCETLSARQLIGVASLQTRANAAKRSARAHGLRRACDLTAECGQRWNLRSVVSHARKCGAALYFSIKKYTHSPSWSTCPR